VAVNYSSDRHRAERFAQGDHRQRGEAISVGADVSKAADVARLFDKVNPPSEKTRRSDQQSPQYSVSAPSRRSPKKAFT
jgi:hypothetical protein